METNLEKISDASVTQLEEEVINKEEELENIILELDSDQEEIEQYQAKNAELLQKINHATSTVSESRIVNRTVKLNTLSGSVQAGFLPEEIQLNEEHKDIISKMKNDIISLRDEYDRNYAANKAIEDEISGIISSNMEIEIENERIKIAYQAEKRKQKELKDDIEAFEYQSKDIENKMQMLSRAINDAENAFTGLTMRKEALSMHKNNPASLRKQIEETIKQIESEKARIVELENTTNSLIENQSSMNEQYSADVKNTMKFIGWENEQSSISNEIQSTEVLIRDQIEENAEYERNISVLTKRYQRLKPIVEKYSIDDIKNHYTNTKDNIDDLLKKSASSRINDNINESTIRKRIQDTKESILINQEKLESFKRELGRVLSLSRQREQNKYEAIDEKRQQSFDIESDLIQKIKDLRIKVAAKKIVTKK